MWFKRGILGKFCFNDFYILIVFYHAAKFKKNLRTNSQMYTCVILVWEWAKISHLSKKKVFVIGFYETGLQNFRPELGQNFPFDPKEEFL